MKKKKGSSKTKLSKKQLKQKRSAAAKKGWETRRKKAQDKKFKKLNPELADIEKEVERRVQKELKKRTAKEIVNILVKEKKVNDDKDSKIKARLRIVGGPDSSDYYDEVLEIANDDDYLDYSPTEIYTMGFY